MKKLSLFFILILLIYGCKQIEYSPNQIFDVDSPRNLNSKNLSKLLSNPGDDTIRFVLCGDSQRALHETNVLVEKVNKMPNIDFLILSGDISEFGVLQEMEWVSRSLSQLKIPFFGVIGNHDLVSNGKQVFQKMFGDLNFSFNYKKAKFICHDTNGREYNFNRQVPDISWLKSELIVSDTIKTIVGISHVPPETADFDNFLLKDYLNTFKSNSSFKASFHAHESRYREFRPDESGIPYVVTADLNSSEFLLVEIINGEIKYERIKY